MALTMRFSPGGWEKKKKRVGAKMILEVLEAEISCHSERIGVENPLKITF